MKEIWKDIKGYKGLYRAFNLGRFQNLRNGKFFSTTSRGLGLRKNGFYKTVTPSRIIAQLFIPNPNKLGIVLFHGEKKNIKSSNLYWSSRSEMLRKARIHVTHKYICQNKECKKIFIIERSNRKYQYCSKKCAKKCISRKTRIRISKCKQQKVLGIKGNKKIIFNSIDEAGRYIKRNPSTISNVLAGRWNTCGGYKFKKLR